MGLIGLISGLKEPDLGQSGLRGGDVRTDGRTYVRTDGRKEIHPCVLQDIGPLGPLPKKRERKRKRNRSPKGNMWSAIPFALLCMIVTLSEMKQGSGPEGDEVL